LGVVKRMEDSADSLTGEQLELDVDHLCKGIEMKEDKKCNKLVRTALCQAGLQNPCKINSFLMYISPINISEFGRL